MTWSAFRPSDDANEYHYFVPGNMFAVVVLGYLEEIFTEIIPNEDKVSRAKKLREEIEKGIKEYAIVKNEQGEYVYVYEVDGLGIHYIMVVTYVRSIFS